MPRRILIVGSLADSLINFRGDLIADLVSRGNTVFGCAPDGSEELRGKLAEKGANYIQMPLQRTGMNFFEDFKTIGALRKIIREGNFDVVLSYTIKPVIYASLAARLNSTTTVCSIVTGVGYAFTNTSLKGRAISIPAKLLLKLAFRFNDTVFFQNSDDRDLFLKRRIVSDNVPIRIVNGSGVNTSFFKPLQFPKIVTFLMLARLVKEKGVHEYAEACKIVRQRYPAVRCLLAGFIDTNPGAIQESDLQTWQNEGSIEFLDEITDVNAVFASCSVYVLPSYREGTPRSVLEAMSTGRPIVTTDAPGCKETVVNGLNGYTVPVGDSTRLAEKMMYFVENPTKILEMGLESRKLAVEKYDVGKVNQQIIAGINAVSEHSI